MKKLASTSILFVILLTVILSASLYFVYEQDKGLGKRIVSEEKLWETVNEWRVNNNYNTYLKDDFLCNYAQKRVGEIQLDYSHNGFLKDTVMWNNSRYKKRAENIAKVNGWINEAGVLDMWINSSSHAANLKNDYGLSCIKCQSNYCVQIFGKN